MDSESVRVGRRGEMVEDAEEVEDVERALERVRLRDERGEVRGAGSDGGVGRG